MKRSSGSSKPCIFKQNTIMQSLFALLICYCDNPCMTNMKTERNIATMFWIECRDTQTLCFIYIDKICTISRLHGDEDTTTWKQWKFLVTSNLLYNFRFMTNLKNSYVFPLYISFHDKLDTALTPSSKDEEMI